MRVLISLHHHFKKTPDGTVYPYSVFDYSFWQRYLEVFDEVVVFARLEKVDGIQFLNIPNVSSGPSVKFVQLPDFLGAWGYVKALSAIKATAQEVLAEPCACIIRIPSTIGTVLWKALCKTGHPYGVEVVGDPWDGFSRGSIKTPFRPVIRMKTTMDMRKQCQFADVAAYVTEFGLQKRYPPGNWNTHYSSIELPADAIVDEQIVKQRLERIEGKISSNEPWRLCYVGSMWHLSKAPDILIASVAQCVNAGENLELIMVGDGKHRSELEKQAQDLGIAENVKFIGHVAPGQEVYDQLDAADVYVLPSRQEGLPRSVIEAMSRALPCITSDVAGLPELVKPEYLVKPNDVNGLANTIKIMVSDIDAMKKNVKRNVNKASEYRTDVLQTRRVELYSRLKDITQKWYNDTKR